MRVGDAELHVRTGGPEDGLPVVLLHAFPFSHALFDPQFPALEREFRVAAFDFRGHGGSPVPPAPPTMETLVDDLLGVMDGLGMERAVLLGVSMGGYCALRAAEREPGRVAGLVLADTKSAADGDEGKAVRTTLAARVREQGAAAFAEGFQRVVLSGRTLGERPAVAARVRELIAANPVEGIAGALHALSSRTDTTPALGGFRFPVLVVVGGEDALTPPEEARAMAAAIPGASCAVIPGTGHLPNLEDPAAFEAAVLPFLRGVARSRSKVRESPGPS